MTLKVRIQVPKNNGPYEAKIETPSVGQILEPGEEIELYVHSGNDIRITEVPAGTKAGTVPGQHPAVAGMQALDNDGKAQTAS